MSEVVHTPWTASFPPSEADLRARMAQEGLDAQSWSNASGDRYDVHNHDYHKVVYCVEGSIWFMITDERDRSIELQPGDRLEIPAGVRHSAIAGIDGVTCLEGHR